MSGLGITTADRYRTVDETRIVELLMLWGWAFEVREGRRTEAEARARAALDRWTRMGLGFTGGAGERRFDPAEVVNFHKHAGLTGRDPFWEGRYVATARRLVTALHGAPRAEGPAPDPARLPPARFRVSLARTYALQGADERLRLRLPAPTEDTHLAELTLEGAAAAPVTWAPGRMETRVEAAGAESQLRLTAAFTARPTLGDDAPAVLDDAERALYLRAREGLIRVSPRVSALAKALGEEAADDGAFARRAFDHLIDNFTLGVIHYDEIDPAAPTDWPLDHGWFDCQLGAALLAALCRARGVPARLVSGYQLYAPIPALHYWTEVWREGRGWAPYDLTAWDLSRAGRDADWREIFVGKVDYRMVTERLPRLFTGQSSVRLPPAWHMLTRPLEDGCEIAFVDAFTGAPAWRDAVQVIEGPGV